jgi:hypothetical protein
MLVRRYLKLGVDICQLIAGMMNAGMQEFRIVIFLCD